MADDVQNQPVTNSELAQAQQKIAELTEMSKRALADLANYKKRVEEEKAGFVKFANMSLILEILPVLDNFKRAFVHIPKELNENEWVKGVVQIERQLMEAFAKQGVAEIKVGKGEKLDILKHEAILQGPGEKDIILEELEKGYVFENKVIRPAKVKVGDGNIDGNIAKKPLTPII